VCWLAFCTLQCAIVCVLVYQISLCGSQWPRGLRRRCTAARMLRLWVRIPPRAWMFVCCDCCVLSGRGICDELITRPEDSYRLWCVVCDLETSWVRGPWPTGGGLSRPKKRSYLFNDTNWMHSLYLLHIYILLLLYVSMFLRPPSGGIYVFLTHIHFLLHSNTCGLAIVKAAVNETFFIYNQQKHSQYHNSIHHNSTSVQSTLLHVSTIFRVTTRQFTANVLLSYTHSANCSCWKYSL